MTLLKRISKLAETEGLSVTRLEQVIGASRGVLSRAIKNDTDIQSKWLQKIIENYPNYSPAWLLTGKGKIFNEWDDFEISPLREPKQVYQHKTDLLIDKQAIPLYDIEATAGLKSLFSNSNNSLPIDYIRIPNLPKCDGAISVTGDSMYPLLKSGDIVMYKEITDFINDVFYGEMYLISIELAGDEMIMVKYIQKSTRGEKYYTLVSYNTNHQPKDVPISNIRALALVKATIRINSMQ